MGDTTSLDTFEQRHMIPVRLGSRTTMIGEEVVGLMEVRAPAVSHGALRASAVLNLADIVGPIASDRRTDVWTFTSSLAVHVPATPAPERLEGRVRILRSGRRSSTIEVSVTLPDGTPWAVAIAGFTQVPVREGDPEKPLPDLGQMDALWRLVEPLEQDFAEACGVRSIDPSAGLVEVDLFAEILNPAGALHGAVIGLIAECSAQDLATHHLGAPQIVTDLDVHFLSQARIGPVRATSRFVGDPRQRIIVTELVDLGRPDAIVATVTASTADAPATD